MSDVLYEGLAPATVRDPFCKGSVVRYLRFHSRRRRHRQQQRSRGAAHRRRPAGCTPRHRAAANADAHLPTQPPSPTDGVSQQIASARALRPHSRPPRASGRREGAALPLTPLVQKTPLPRATGTAPLPRFSSSGRRRTPTQPPTAARLPCPPGPYPRLTHARSHAWSVARPAARTHA